MATNIGRYARIGAYSANAKRDADAHAASMRRALYATFLQGHGCAVCPRIDIPAGVTDADRRKRAQSLWHLHFLRMRRAQLANTRSVA